MKIFSRWLPTVGTLVEHTDGAVYIGSHDHKMYALDAAS